MNNLPSKKVLSVFVIVTSFVISIIIVFGKEKTSSAINYASNLVAGDKIRVSENKNWQNDLQKLNIINTATSSKDEKETTTDAISRTLISNYLSLKQSGTFDENSSKALVDQTIEYLDKTTDQETFISKLENVAEDNGRISIAEYGDNLGNILKINKPENVKNELEIITSALSQNNVSKIKELESIINTYEKTAKDLTTMKVPKTFVKAHLDIINGMFGMAKSLKESSAVFEDPFLGLSLIQEYQKSGLKMYGAIEAVKKYIKENNIVYKQGSGGYYLYYGI